MCYYTSSATAKVCQDYKKLKFLSSFNNMNKDIFGTPFGNSPKMNKKLLFLWLTKG